LLSLDEQIQGTPLVRRVANAQDLRQPTRLCCFGSERRNALDWFRQQAQRAPDDLAVLDDSFRRWRLPAPEPALGHVVFGERLRAKATRLASHGCERLLYAADPRLNPCRYAQGYVEQNHAQFERLWQALEDDESRLVLGAILRQRSSGDLGYLRVSQYPEYFHPIVKAEPGESVVDAGAFNGATSAAFARAVGRRGRVYAFEPSRDNRALIRRRLLRPWNWGLRVEVVPEALADAVGEAHFDQGRGGSGSLREGAAAPAHTEAVAVTTLDEFTKSGRRVDVISLDVEGAEPRVLAGADRLIETQRPKLQISVYHDSLHLFELPLRLLERYPDYALFLGHHDIYSTETDAYLMPRERLPKTAA
jgi:FkbM family methyltransferase